jgi:hypothetical protein
MQIVTDPSSADLVPLTIICDSAICLTDLQNQKELYPLWQQARRECLDVFKIAKKRLSTKIPLCGKAGLKEQMSNKNFPRETKIEGAIEVNIRLVL